MAMRCECGPLKCKGQSIGKSFKTLHFWLSDQRSHWVHRKANTIKRGWGVDHDSIAQVLRDIAPKPSTTFSKTYLSKSFVANSVPPKLIYPDPPSSSRQCHSQNPNNSDPPKWISVLPRWPCQLSVTYCNYFGLTEFFNRCHRDGLPTFYCLIAIISVPPRWCNRCHRNEDMPTIALRLLRVVSIRSHRDRQRSYLLHSSVSPRFLIGATELGQKCVTVGFRVEAIYTPPPPLISWESHQNETTLPLSIFWEENYLLMCWDQEIPILSFEPWFLAYPKLLSTQILLLP